MLQQQGARWLKMIFMPALAWAFFWLGIFGFGQQVYLLNPFPEGYRLHVAFEEYLPYLSAIAAAGVVTLLAGRLWPGFLCVPRRVSPWRFVIALGLAVPVVALVLLAVLGAACLLLDLSSPPPDNPQYIPAVFWAAPMGAIGLTPLASVCAAWWWMIRRTRREFKNL